MITLKIQKGQVERILVGLLLLNGIKSVLLGMIRAELSDCFEPKLKTFKEGLKNPEFDKLQQEAAEINAKYADDVARRTAELSAINRKGDAILKAKNRQLEEYDRIMEEEITVKVDRLIPINLLPEKETPNEAIKLLKPVINFKDGKR